MIRLAIIILLVSFTAIAANGQSLNKMLQSLNTSHISHAHEDSIESITVMAEKTRINTLKDRYYHWYGNNQIKATIGGYGGRLLNGDYKLFNREKDLLAQGEFKCGLKTGEWIYWYTNGTIARAERWKKGIRAGEFVEYYQDGAIKSTGSYKQGLLHGKVYQYNPDGGREAVKYSYGKIVVPKPKKEKVKPEKETIRRKFNLKLRKLRKEPKEAMQ
jgi:antitoxin component YwqK of YwqJK toxin-antitoxin module